MIFMINKPKKFPIILSVLIKLRTYRLALATDDYKAVCSSYALLYTLILYSYFIFSDWIVIELYDKITGLELINPTSTIVPGPG